MVFALENVTACKVKLRVLSFCVTPTPTNRQNATVQLFVAEPNCYTELKISSAFLRPRPRISRNVFAIVGLLCGLCQGDAACRKENED